MKDEGRPVLIGAGQLVQREVELARAPTPLDLLESAAREAAVDAGVAARALEALDTVAVVDVVGWRPQNAPGLLAERLGARPRREWVSCIGGEAPLVLLNRAARAIAAGEARLALVAGANLVRTLRRAQQARVRVRWEKGGTGQPDLVGENRRGTSVEEAEYGLDLPPNVYPIFESALRARRGLEPEEHRRRIGRLMSRFSEVAARNPYAWFPVARSAEEIATPAARNREIAAPYTKYMNAVIETDQAAAVLLCSAAAARELGVPEERWVHWWGGAQSQEEHWYPSERPDLSRSRALARNARAALEDAELAVEELTHLDLYSCFPVAVELAVEALGLDEADPRGFTVTGGLPYFGGPGNNYTLHAVAALVERLRAEPGGAGLATGNGWYVTKHAGSVLAGRPRESTFALPKAERPPAVPEATRSTGPAQGAARVLAYTVLYDREGGPARGIVVGETEAGQRFVANTPEDRSLLEAFASGEQVGSAGRVRRESERNLFAPA